MSTLKKDYQIQFIPGSPGIPGISGQPATPGYYVTSTVKHIDSTPYVTAKTDTTQFANLRFATHDEIRAILPGIYNDCAMQIAILTLIMTSKTINVPLRWIRPNQCLIITNMSNGSTLGLGLCVLTTNDASTIHSFENPSYNGSYKYSGEITGC